MKKVALLFTFGILFITSIQAQTNYQYTVITTVESIIPSGLGRSRMISPISKVDSDAFTTERTNGKQGKAQRKVKRRDLKIDNIEETKLLNFYSIAGINFQNIASNDALIGDRLSKMDLDGWELAFVTSGVESDSGADDGQGIYLTRYIFKKAIVKEEE